MELRVPSYYKKFHCIADQCTDCCCIGWEIGIDSDTAQYYQSVPGKMGEELRSRIQDGCFLLDDGDRCPFLNEKNLCRLILHIGESSLCQICRDHPRYFEWFGEIKEGGIGMCCEEAARILMQNPLQIECAAIPYEDNSGCDAELFAFLDTARSMMLEHLQDSGIPLPQAVCDILNFAEILQENADNGILEIPGMPHDTGGCTSSEMDGIFAFFAKLEPFDAAWTERMEHLKGVSCCIPESAVFWLRNIGSYFLFRYLMKGVFSGEFLSAVCLTAMSIAVLGTLFSHETRDLAFEECVMLAVKYSKETEYSEENLNALLDACYENPCFSPKALKALFRL